MTSRPPLMIRPLAIPLTPPSPEKAAEPIPFSNLAQPQASSLTTASTSSRPQPHKVRNIAVACQACQHRRRRCTGERPTCQPCKNKATFCVYDHDPSKSRPEALKQKVRALEVEVARLTTTNSHNNNNNNNNSNNNNNNNSHSHNTKIGTALPSAATAAVPPPPPASFTQYCLATPQADGMPGYPFPPITPHYYANPTDFRPVGAQAMVPSMAVEQERIYTDHIHSLRQELASRANENDRLKAYITTLTECNGGGRGGRGDGGGPDATAGTMIQRNIDTLVGETYPSNMYKQEPSAMSSQDRCHSGYTDANDASVSSSSTHTSMSSYSCGNYQDSWPTAAGPMQMASVVQNVAIMPSGNGYFENWFQDNPPR